MTVEEIPNAPCELCGDLTPVLHLHEDADHGWDALCLVCWRLQQPTDTATARASLPWRPGLGRTRRGRQRPEEGASAGEEDAR
jgi:hypothetical protein